MDTIRVRIEKKHTGEIIEGTIEHDGLADLWAVRQTDGSYRYASVIDHVLVWEKI